MSMKAAVGLLALLFATSAFAQTAPPKPSKKPPAQAKPQAPMGCKLVGTVKGTKIWAGECVAANPAENSPAEPGGASPPGEKQ
jgi:hypothetical protein